MLIRKARVEDGVAITSIAETVRYRADFADPTKGYLVFVGTPEEYSRRLEGNDSSYVAEVDGRVVGFLLSCPADNALLIDQIGVLPEFRAAAAMFSLMVAEVQPKRITACIMHGPLFNQRSVGFFKGKCGFQCIGEYNEGDGFTWGIYEWKDL